MNTPNLIQPCILEETNHFELKYATMQRLAIRWREILRNQGLEGKIRRQISALCM
jgi:hypothetical protein